MSSNDIDLTSKPNGMPGYKYDALALVDQMVHEQFGRTVPFPSAENPLKVDEVLPGVIEQLGSDSSDDQGAIHVLVWAAIQACVRDYETGAFDTYHDVP